MVALRRSYPVVIVGGGPAGLTLANLLGTQGIEVLLVERNPSTVHEPRAVSIDDESLRAMQAAGLVDKVRAAIVPGYGSHYLSPGGTCFAKVEPTGTPYGYPRRNAFRQPILERQLLEGLARFANVTTRFCCAATGFAQTPEGVTLELRDEDGNTHRVGCDYLVGCDGASSTVRKQLGITLEGASFKERWLIVDLEDSESETHHTKVFCDPLRPCITLPGPDRTRRYEFKLHDHEGEEDLLDPTTVDRLLATHCADPRSNIRRKVVYTFHARMATRWAEGRVFLAGDAAHLTPPFAGQGMNSGIRDVHNLFWKLAAVLHGRAGPRLLDSYEAERRDHAWQMIQLALRMGRIMAPRNMLSAMLVQMGFLALHLCPPARDYVAEMKYKPKPRFAEGFLVPDGRSSRQTLVGRLFPQPRLRRLDGTRALLDDILGNDFAVLAYGIPPGELRSVFGLPLWDRLGAKRLAILPRGANPAQATAAFPVAIDENGALARALAPYSGHLLLLRPDHYVAAAFPLAEAARGVDGIEALLAQSWEHDNRAASAHPVAAEADP
jgi:3-(3-hydroxy-phenyl)propionate hydroxylase